MSQDGYRLQCQVREYDWGNAGPGVLRSFLEAAGRGVADGTPLAELWMGAHPSAPAIIQSTGESLLEAIAADPKHFLGPTLYSRGVRTLPFLFKVLDAGRPLSIQAHPDLELAATLHQRDPKNYPDSNHKPELAISLGEMDALLGFRPIDQIRSALQQFSELAELCGPPDGTANASESSNADGGVADSEKAWLKTCFGNLMRASAALVSEAAARHQARNTESARSTYQWFTKLVELFGPGDPGIFCPYFLNLVRIPEGQAAFLGPNEPHAYLHGPILECMSSSDNVVRAGLTGKFRDVQTLIEMLHYRAGLPELLRAHQHSADLSAFATPVPDFVVEQLTAPAAAALQAIEFPSIIVALAGSRVGPGEGHEWTMAHGDVVFFPGDLAARGKTPRLRCSPDARLYRATVRPDFGLPRQNG